MKHGARALGRPEEVVVLASHASRAAAKHLALWVGVWRRHATCTLPPTSVYLLLPDICSHCAIALFMCMLHVPPHGGASRRLYNLCVYSRHMRAIK